MNQNEDMELNENDDLSDSSNEDEDQELQLRCKELESELLNNKYLYDVHVQLVDLYEKMVNLESLRAAYERFHECYPLTSKLWLKWIKNEIKVATSDQEKQHIFKLFEKAVEDYLSVNLWQEYAQYAMDISNLESTRNILEKALNAAGLHASDGSLLWDFIREIELASLSVSSVGSEAWKEQVARVVEIFRRQLSIPLIGMENTYDEWKEWLKTLPEDFKINAEPIEWGYQKALKLLETYKPFEDELTIAENENELHEIYKRYIDSVKDPSTVICLYERAVSQLCLDPSLWLNYCEYTFKLGEVALKTCTRSLRNCPWSEELWVMKLRILENLNTEENEVLSSFEKGLSSISPAPGLQLWFTYIEYVKRNSNDGNKLMKLLEKASEQVGDFDTNSTLDRFHARILARNGEIKEAMLIWNKIVGKMQNKGNLTIWLEFIALVKQFGEVNQTRSLFQRALNSCKDWAYYIAEEWLLFEREFGTLSNVLKCLEKCKSVNTNQQQSQQQCSNQSDVSENTQYTDSNKKGKKRKFETEIKVEFKKVKKEVEKMTIEPKKPIEKDPTKTVFISNIGPNVNEDILKTMFPNAENIEVCRDRKGKSKCFGYVQFKIEEEVMTALARDREPLDGRPVFVSNCKPDKKERKTVFKYSSEPEENKLFVRGLPKEMTKEEVMEIFKPYGAVDTRIVLHKSGQSKGLAYIEFPNPESTKKALEATDQKQIGEHTISVALSAPPPKKAMDEKSIEPIRHARSRLQVPFIPRAIQVKNDKASSENGQVSTPKSNDDFRKLLLKK
ncbi:hypothetical protein HHI36_000456 [Cryptolaemus montrouzieri]|uniref:RRM domain-containing protein n=1 Tax=Cryptolaemus montrouzieri TaxID=559131 RepID=A0ABD2P5F3_9CUCU